MKKLIPVEIIERNIYLVRGEKVMPTVTLLHSTKWRLLTSTRL